jgi:hypothetical protein
MNELQAMLDALIKECGDGYKISGNKILRIKAPVLKTVLRVSTSFYDTYVGEKGALYQYADFDTILNDEFVELLKEKSPKRFTVANKDDEYTFSHIEFDGVKQELTKSKQIEYTFSTDHMEEFKKLVFDKVNDTYVLNTSASGIEYEEHEPCSLQHISMEILDVERCQKSKHVEEFD